MSLRRTTMRNAHRSRAVLTINPERSWLRLSTRCHVRGPHVFPWTKERLILSWAESTPSLHSPRARLPMQGEIAWLLLC